LGGVAREADVQLATMLCVHDLERSLAFYLALGFRLVVHRSGIEFLTPPKSPPW
jgi:catechol 2,3-dioxygenase-like lactoylglutathione lyase family enzyme